MPTTYKQQPIPLISIDPTTGNYNLTTEGSQFLTSIPGPIGVVSVAGLSQTGKSYLLNQMLLNRCNGFAVGSTDWPCTKGLWCWGVPIKGQTTDGQKLNIIVIDTEGMDTSDEDQTHDTRILTLALLASSYFIYNSICPINETTLQNLNLFGNITKNIKLRTDQVLLDESPQKIANYLPAFCWVMQDHPLQLIDSEGNNLSSKQYLEKALALQESTDTSSQQKTKFLKFLTSYFKTCQYLPLVSPLTNSSQLQQLQKINVDDLQPEFVKQVIHYRKKIILNMKPKILNGLKLNGELFADLLRSYIQAINDGSALNIQNAWNYICQQQCSKLMSEAMQVFQQQLNQAKLPCSSEEMNEIIETAEEAVYQIFKTKSIGENAEQCWKQLRQQMKLRGKQLRQSNADQGKIVFKKYIAPFTAQIQSKINKQQYTSIEQFLQQLNTIQQKITKQCPNCIDSQIHCQVSLQKLFNQSLSFLAKKLKNENQQLKHTFKQILKQHQTQLSKLTKYQQQQQTNTKQQLFSLNKQKIELTFQVEKLSLQLQQVLKQHQQVEQLLQTNLNKKNNQLEEMKKLCEIKIEQANHTLDQMMKSAYHQQSNWQKQKALYELKIDQQTEKLDDLDKKRQVLESKLALETQELAQKYRQQTIKLEEQIRDLVQTLVDEKDKRDELSTNYRELNDKYQVVNDKFEGIVGKMKEEATTKMREIQLIKSQHESQLTNLKNQLSSKQDQLASSEHQFSQKLKKQQSRSRQLSQQLKTLKSKSQRQNQLLLQQLQFIKKTNEQTKLKLAQIKMVHQNKISVMEAERGSQREEQSKNKIVQVKIQYEQQLNHMQKQYKDRQNDFYLQITNLSKSKNQLQLQLKITSQQLINDKIQYQETKQNLVTKLEYLQNQIQQNQKDKNIELSTKEGIFNEKLGLLEKELQQARECYHRQKAELEKRVGNQIIQIKNYYEMERDKQETRHSEEKDKLKKKYSKTVDDYQTKLQEQSQNYQQQLEKLQSEYVNEIRTLSLTLNQLTHQKDILARQKTTLETHLTQLTNTHTKIQSQLTDKYQKLVTTSQVEKQLFRKKLEQLNQVKNQMEKQLLSAAREKDQYRYQLQKLVAEIGQLKQQNGSLVNRCQTTKTNLQQQITDIQTTQMKDKTKYQTDVALLEQKNSFTSDKIHELQSEFTNRRERQQQQLKQIKESYQQEIAHLTLKMNQQRKNYQEKMERYKKISIQTQNNLSKQLSEVGIAKAVNDQKIEYLTKILTQTQTKRQTQVDSLTDQLKTLKDKTSTEKLLLKTKIDQLVGALHGRQTQLTELKNQYQIQFALAESKTKSQLQWSDALIAEKFEMIKTLEKQLQQSRKRAETEKTAQIVSHQQLLSRTESQYRTQLTQLNQEITKKNQQIQHMAKQHERDTQNLNEKLSSQKQVRISLQSKLSKSQTQSLQKQTKLTSQLTTLRQTTQLQTQENQKALLRLKQHFNLKLHQCQKRALQTDKLKQQALFDKEKLQAKWKIERKLMEERIAEFRENLDKEQSQIKKLVKDNQKLKVEKKKNNSFILLKNQTSFLSKENGTDNKENIR